MTKVLSAALTWPLALPLDADLLESLWLVELLWATAPNDTMQAIAAVANPNFIAFILIRLHSIPEFDDGRAEVPQAASAKLTRRYDYVGTMKLLFLKMPLSESCRDASRS